MYPKASVVKPCTLTLASLLVTVGTLLLFFIPWIYEFATNAVLSLSSKPTFTLWQKNPLPLYLEFYFFNWTNPMDVYKPNVKPRFEEIGPFVFEETKEKVNITWNANNTVTFNLLRHWYFRENMSCCKLYTNITTINSVALTAAHMIKDWSYVLKKGFDFSINAKSTKIYKKTTVGEVLFDGYEDPLINMAKAMPEIGGLSIPDYDKFGWFYKRNASYTFEGAVTMESSGKNFGNTVAWKYESDTSYFEGECNKVRGSAGEFFSPNRQRDRIGFFSTDLCRYVPLDYVQDENVDGIKGYKYILGDSFLDNGTNIPENKCYCGDYCTPYGALNISSCRYGAPGFVSQPHFYGADPYYLDKIEGLNPTKEKHQMFMVIEPGTGIPLNVAARLQLNLLVEPINHIGIFENVPTFVFPVVWFEQKARIPSTLNFLLKTFLHLPLILRIVCAAVLILAIPWLTFLLYRPIVKKLCWRSSKPKTVLQELSTPEITDCELPLMKPKDSSDIR